MEMQAELTDNRPHEKKRPENRLNGAADRGGQVGDGGDCRVAPAELRLFFSRFARIMNFRV